MYITTEDVPDRQTLISLCKKGMIALLVTIMIPATTVIAPPGEAVAEEENITTTAKYEPQGEEVLVEISAYNTVPAQTDDTPCIAANGENICLPHKRNTIASNFLPFGTRVLIPSISDEPFVVRDRMNRRYDPEFGFYADVLAETRSEALRIGREKRVMVILAPQDGTHDLAVAN